MSSQAALMQTAVPAAASHVPFNTGEWAIIVGMAVPFGSFAVQTLVSVLQNCVEAQSSSTVHVAGAWHTPEIEQAPERQITAAFAEVHGPEPFA
ncbi:MAG TPA: hypothetical protein VER11_34175 [Polyangiaceae bacterium]|nr:hypothetical protein [Polyangiaceae bacterium]